MCCVVSPEVPRVSAEVCVCCVVSLVKAQRCVCVVLCLPKSLV